MIDPFEYPSDAPKEFVCIKCKDTFEYEEFFKHDDPTFDYGYYILKDSAYAVGVQVVEGVDLCEWCVPVMNYNNKKEINND